MSQCVRLDIVVSKEYTREHHAVGAEKGLSGVYDMLRSNKAMGIYTSLIYHPVRIHFTQSM